MVGPPSVGPEINIDSILALGKRVEEGAENVIQLKRARNSLLNISARVPPEILGYIFRWNVIPEGEFDGLEKGSYNFLLVCHHWFQVASSTPELWAFWGNTLKQWSQRYRRSGTAPLDLVLDGSYHMNEMNAIPFDGPLRDALRDRAASDSIRSVHLKGPDADFLRSILSSLTLDGGGVRCSSIESLILEFHGINISDFLACYRFPKLRNLRLFTRAWTSSWNHLKLQATSLTTLSLEFGRTPSNPTTSNLLSILVSYPNLQVLSLDEVVSRDVGDEYKFRVSLRRLKKLHLRGDCRRVFRLLDRLESPDTLDNVDLDLLDCATEGISEFLASYLQDRTRRDHRFQGRVLIYFCSEPRFISFNIDVVDEFNIPIMPPGLGRPSISFGAVFRDPLPQDARERKCVNLIASTPREHVVGLTGWLSTHTTRDLIVTMPNLEYLYLVGSVVSDMFLQPDPPSLRKFLPSLRILCLGCFTLQNDDDWGPLINYLAHQTSGGQAISLRLYAEPGPIPPEVVKRIEDLVEEFSLGFPSAK